LLVSEECAVTKKARPTSEELLGLVVKNALDFLEQSVAALSKRPKYSLIDFCSAVELLLKARLMREHWALIIAKPENANLTQLSEGDFRSVAMDEAITRLRNVADEPISREEERCFQGLRQHRNKLVHFFHEQYASSPPDQKAIEEVVVEQCKAWFYLHRLLTGRWASHFKPYAKAIKAVDKKMQKNRNFLKGKYEAILPDIKKEITAGAQYELCSSCGFEARRIEEYSEPLYQAICKVCGAERGFLQVACPQCGESIRVHDMGEAECPNEDFDVTLEWLLDKYGPVEDPKEDPEVAFCAYCERAEPTAIPFGEFEYLCLSCRGLHDSADNCEWCGALNASLKDDSYLGGCVVCGGKFSSESFARE